MSILPDHALPLLLSFAPVFSQPTSQRFLLLLGSAIITRDLARSPTCSEPSERSRPDIVPATVASSPNRVGPCSAWLAL